jgi:hypothetical protein
MLQATQLETRQVLVPARHYQTGNPLPSVEPNTTIDPCKPVAFPFNWDSEFVNQSDPFENPVAQRFYVTTQIRSPYLQSGVIYCHPDMLSTERELRHPVSIHDFVFLDYLNHLGFNVECHHTQIDDEFRQLPRFDVVLYAHFALVDIIPLATTENAVDELVSLFKQGKFEMGRRLIARTKKFNGAILPYRIVLDGHPFRLCIKVVDTAALHGIAGYKDIAKNVGFELNAKELAHELAPNGKRWIEQMDRFYFERPNDYDDYALGDLYITDLLKKNGRIFHHIFNELHIGDHWRHQRMSIGQAVADIIKARVTTIVQNEDLDDLTGNHNAVSLSYKHREKDPLALLSKVDGGRCRSNAPIIARLFGALVDTDIGGAYATGMTPIPLVLGRVRLKSWGKSAPNIDRKPDLAPCPNLKSWLARYENRLEDRTWFARIHTRELLEFEQDLFASWFDYAQVDKAKAREDDSLTLGAARPETGEIAIFAREIRNGTLTSDLLEVARRTMSARQYNEFVNKTVVRAVAYVFKSDYVKPEDFNSAQSEYKWTSATLGEILSDVARAKRGQYPKGSSLNSLYKLISNTSYGDSVSRFFETSSTIAGSNVTAIVRSFLYLSEKGLNLVGSITDGQLFDLNKVVYPKRGSLNLERFTRAYAMSSRELDNSYIQLKPIVGKHIKTNLNDGEVELMVVGTGEVYKGKAAEQFINDKSLEHLRRLFPDVSLLNDTFKVVDSFDNENETVLYRDRNGLFEFEMKAFVKAASIHGSANYQHIGYFEDDDNKGVYIEKTKTKARSYSDKDIYRAFTINSDGELKPLELYNGSNPANHLLQQLKERPRAVDILPPFIRSMILKPNMYKRIVKYNENEMLAPGDTVYMKGRPRAFSLKQFTFGDYNQYKHWNRENNRMKNKYGLSFELYFINDDGRTIDYLTMIETIDKLVRQGVVVEIRKEIERLGFKLKTSALVEEYRQAEAVASNHLNDHLINHDDMGYEVIEYGDE